MNAIKFTEHIQIKAPAERVFDCTQDYSKRLVWDTFLQKAHLMEGATGAGKGVRAYCEARNGMGMVTEYVTFNRPKVTAIKMTKGPYLFKSFAGSWTFKEQGSHCTEVVFLYSFELRFPFSIWWVLVRWILKRNVAQRLKDLKECLEKERV